MSILDGFPIDRQFFEGGKDLTDPAGLAAILNNVDDELQALTDALATATGLTGYVVVEDKSDLPTPSGSAIQGADNTVYQLNGAIDLGADHFLYGANTLVIGNASQRDSLTSTTSGGILRAAGGVNLVAKNLAIISPNGPMFDCNGCPSVFINACTSNNAAKFAKFENCAIVSILLSSGVGISGSNDGIELVNSSFGTRFAMVLSSLVQASGGTGALINLGTSTWAGIALNDAELVSAATGRDITGMANNGNLLAVVGRARFFGNIINGSGQHLENITTDDTQWNFKTNVGVPDSIVLGSLSMAGNAVATTIGSTDVFVKAAGDTTLTTAKRIDANSLENNMRLIDVDDHVVVINVTVDILKSGGAKLFNLQLHLDGAPIGIPIPVDVLNSGSSRSFSVVHEGLDTNEQLDLRIANTIDTDDATVTELSMVLSAVA